MKIFFKAFYVTMNSKKGFHRYYRHVKSGREYIYISKARLERNLQPVVVYKSLNASGSSPAQEIMWVRPEKEFFDGRFERIDWIEGAVKKD